jgi:quercetin dioxygenase-like cupin family protein
LQSQAFPEPVYNTVTVRTLVDNGGTVLRHTHPGVEMAYIVSGEALVKIMDRPDQTLKAGDSFTVPPETPHSVQNVGPEALTIVSTYVVNRSKPIATPAPLPTP